MSASDPIAIVNARIRTGNPRRPWAEAVLMQGDRIELVGSSAEVRKRIVPSTRVIDVRGMLVMPAWKNAGRHAGEPELVEALYTIARGSADETINVLEAAAPASLVVLDRDITRATPGDVDRAQVVLAIEAGRVVLERAGLG